ncbi:nucleotidyl transferase AbiEii/AbiGii toxin family protein [Joostella atrarenae]|uniref:Nucleotidyl transferase AbiEii/AbiGii toxin family protein n=1 Tax=Joostella atrarenae TaxID=679257 RepID=A0ABS9J7G3_9FLAO|nr:nucleotidyl transferase AbiEii/AbiGii toxin family protein [Joostella atrarenae]MCF8716372.1 nucleotidyl transferase AbiEii/AbiGii toxin family protein [Joostella atrarenae]
MMKKAISSALLKTIKELHTLDSLKGFALAGGTNLALRFNHRESIDIDLFCPEIIGRKGFREIEEEVKVFYGDNAFGFIDPTNINDQFTFLRFFIRKDSTIIKVDIIQNMKIIDPFEELKGVRLFSVRDIALFKLMSASSRPARKDIYDLYYITKEYSLIDLYSQLLEKHKRFDKEEDRNIFDLDNEDTALDNPLLLLRFDRKYKVSKDKMMHSHDNIVTIEGADSWQMASMRWRIHLRRLCSFLDIDYPSARI